MQQPRKDDPPVEFNIELAKKLKDKCHKVRTTDIPPQEFIALHLNHNELQEHFVFLPLFLKWINEQNDFLAATGKVTGLVVRYADFDRKKNILIAVAGLNITSLSMRNCGLTDDDIKILTANQNLINLNVTNNNLTKVGVKTAITSLPNLITLRVADNKTVPDEFRDAVPIQLSVDIIPHNAVSPSAILSMLDSKGETPIVTHDKIPQRNVTSELEKCIKDGTLVISGTNEQALEYVCSLRGFLESHPKIKSVKIDKLDFNGREERDLAKVDKEYQAILYQDKDDSVKQREKKLTDDTKLLRRLAKLDIHTLELKTCNINSEALSVITSNQGIRHLSLPENPIDEKGMQLIISNMPELEELNIRHCEVTATGMKGISKLSKLRRLHVSGNKIENAGADEIMKSDSIIFVDVLEREEIKLPAGNTELHGRRKSQLMQNFRADLRSSISASKVELLREKISQNQKNQGVHNARLSMTVAAKLKLDESTDQQKVFSPISAKDKQDLEKTCKAILLKIDDYVREKKPWVATNCVGGKSLTLHNGSQMTLPKKMRKIIKPIQQVQSDKKADFPGSKCWSETLAKVMSRGAAAHKETKSLDVTRKDFYRLFSNTKEAKKEFCKALNIKEEDLYSLDEHGLDIYKLV